jgi:NAD-dependent deacetylase
VEHLVVLSGAGVSADSGLATFRDSGGLWEGFSIEDVASIDGWYRDKKKVLDFYNKRREQAATAEPNAGHRAIADLEEFFNVSVVTQNVDDLHERAGSSNVIHLHGMLREARSEKDPDFVIDIGNRPIQLRRKSP